MAVGENDNKFQVNRIHRYGRQVNSRQAENSRFPRKRRASIRGIEWSFWTTVARLHETGAKYKDSTDGGASMGKNQVAYNELMRRPLRIWDYY